MIIATLKPLPASNPAASLSDAVSESASGPDVSRSQ